ncbi:MAG TPA: ribonuclease H-like domain-containing protein [Anaeromyxobacteraceae bacterium]
MLHSTFQLTPGIGPYRERQLWAAGVRSWEAFPAAPQVALSARLDDRLRQALEEARAALAAGDAGRLAAMMPSRERWRLYRRFEADAAFLDIETDGGDLVTAVGVLDRDGPRVFLRGKDLEDFPAATRGWKVLVTFNGLSFDVPILERAFPGWRAPRAHVDLRHLWGRLGHQGGLKLLEQETGVGRPGHLAGVDGLEAVRLWRRHRQGDPAALRLLAEYNLYDAVNLKALMALGYNRMLGRFELPGEPVAPWERGEVLYDVTKRLMAI